MPMVLLRSRLLTRDLNVEHPLLLTMCLMIRTLLLYAL